MHGTGFTGTPFDRASTQSMIAVDASPLPPTDFDDDSFRQEDNVFSDFFEMPDHPDIPTIEDTLDDIDGFQMILHLRNFFIR